jgi:hypothetical protein
LVKALGLMVTLGEAGVAGLMGVIISPKAVDISKECRAGLTGDAGVSILGWVLPRVNIRAVA